MNRIFYNKNQVLLFLVLLIVLASIGFSDKYYQGWYQQWITGLNGTTIKDITFLDSLTGFAVTTTNTSVQAYILKTTNGGDNWNRIYTYTPPSVNSGFTRLQFANNNTGYASTNYYDLLKTTDNGTTWVNYPNVPFGAEDMAVINKDSILVVTSNGLAGGVYRTTNGGINWQYLWTNGSSGNPSKIYMYDRNLGFICQPTTGVSRFRRTTNGGFNWTLLNDTNFYDIKFADSVTGYKVFYNSVKKTTDAGITWTQQAQANTYTHTGLKISLINKDTLWFTGPCVFRNGFPYGVIYKTTNGGLNWGYQIPDTSIRIDQYWFICFTNKNNGWAYRDSVGLHTKVGGNDTTYFMSVGNNVSTVPADFVLYQNYPNPFNQSTIIKYQSLITGNIKIIIYDIKGKEIRSLLNERKARGSYSVRFDAGNLSSGIYFYSLFVDGKMVLTKKMTLIK